MHPILTGYETSYVGKCQHLFIQQKVSTMVNHVILMYTPYPLYPSSTVTNLPSHHPGFTLLSQLKEVIQIYNKLQK